MIGRYELTRPLKMPHSKNSVWSTRVDAPIEDVPPKELSMADTSWRVHWRCPARGTQDGRDELGRPLQVTQLKDSSMASICVISITTRHDPCGYRPNSVHQFIHPNYSQDRGHLTGDACRCAERHTKITHPTTSKINFSVTAHCTLYPLILLERAWYGLPM